MRKTLFSLLTAAMAFSGCTCTIDPDSVAPPVACLATGCAGKACGYDDCGHVCAQPGDACIVTHRVTGGVFAGGGRSAAAAEHRLRGELSPAGGAIPSTGGHSVSNGSITR
jgi:hypothetical protein